MKINKKILTRAYEIMIKIRVIEENIAKEFRENKILSFLHLSIGQEACAAGVALGIKKKIFFLEIIDLMLTIWQKMEIYQR